MPSSRHPTSCLGSLDVHGLQKMPCPSATTPRRGHFCCRSTPYDIMAAVDRRPPVAPDCCGIRTQPGVSYDAAKRRSKLRRRSQPTSIFNRRRPRRRDSLPQPQQPDRAHRSDLGLHLSHGRGVGRVHRGEHVLGRAGARGVWSLRQPDGARGRGQAGGAGRRPGRGAGLQRHGRGDVDAAADALGRRPHDPHRRVLSQHAGLLREVHPALRRRVRASCPTATTRRWRRPSGPTPS